MENSEGCGKRACDTTMSSRSGRLVSVRLDSVLTAMNLHVQNSVRNLKTLSTRALHGSTVDLNPRDETFMKKDRASCCVLNVHTIQPSTNETELE